MNTAVASVQVFGCFYYTHLLSADVKRAMLPPSAMIMLTVPCDAVARSVMTSSPQMQVGSIMTSSHHHHALLRAERGLKADIRATRQPSAWCMLHAGTVHGGTMARCTVCSVYCTVRGGMVGWWDGGMATHVCGGPKVGRSCKPAAHTRETDRIKRLQNAMTSPGERTSA